MQYKKTESGWEELPQKNVDFGGGLERLAMVTQGKSDIFLADAFYPLIQKIEELSQKKYEDEMRPMRIISDHMRSATFLAMDGVFPSNKDQGYILRRLLRKMVREGRRLGIEKDISVSLVPVIVEMFDWLYPDLNEKQDGIRDVFEKEEEKFRKTLHRGAKEFEKKSAQVTKMISSGGTDELSELAFNMYQSLGYPYEIFAEDIKDLEEKVSEEFLKGLEEKFQQKFDQHQKKSRAGADKKFTGGLADHSEQTIRYHTATHLLHMALRKVLGDQVVQRGSNITGERLRFDFNHGGKLTEDELAEVTKIMNEAVKSSYSVGFEMLPTEEALKTGAIHAFNEKYGEQVKVYYIGDSIDAAVSKEFCGGPHVSNTSEIGELKIFKQEKIGEGLMRIYVK